MEKSKGSGNPWGRECRGIWKASPKGKSSGYVRLQKRAHPRKTRQTQPKGAKWRYHLPMQRKKTWENGQLDKKRAYLEQVLKEKKRKTGAPRHLALTDGLKKTDLAKGGGKKNRPGQGEYGEKLLLLTRIKEGDRRKNMTPILRD